MSRVKLCSWSLSFALWSVAWCCLSWCCLSWCCLSWCCLSVAQEPTPAPTLTPTPTPTLTSPRPFPRSAGADQPVVDQSAVDANKKANKEADKNAGKEIVDGGGSIDLLQSNQPLILQTEAIAGQPYGVGRIKFRLRPGDELIDRTGATLLLSLIHI